MPLRKEVKRVVKALFGIRNIPSVRCFGAMETRLSREIIAICQASRRGQNHVQSRTHRSQDTGEYLLNLVPPNNFTLPPRAVTSKSLPDITTTPIAKTAKRPRPRRTPSLLISSPIMYSVPFDIPPEPRSITKARLSAQVVTRSKPLPPFPPVKLSSALAAAERNFFEYQSEKPNSIGHAPHHSLFYYPDGSATSDTRRHGRIADRVRPIEHSDVLPVATRHREQSIENTQQSSDRSTPRQSFQSLCESRSEYIISLPTNAHLYVDNDLNMSDADEDSDADTIIHHFDNSIQKMIPSPRPLRSFTNSSRATTIQTSYSSLRPNIANDHDEEDIDLHPGYHTDTEISHSGPAATATGSSQRTHTSRRARMPSRRSIAHNRYSTSQHISQLWHDFRADATEDQVINLRGAYVERGGDEDVVRICAHTGQRIWNSDEGQELKSREGFVGDCVVGWKVCLGVTKGWHVVRHSGLMHGIDEGSGWF